MAFGCGCHVHVSSDSNATRVIGTVLFCKKNEENTTHKVRYSAETENRVSLGHDIAADLVTYRKAEDCHAVEVRVDDTIPPVIKSTPYEDKSKGSVESIENVIVSTTSESPSLHDNMDNDVDNEKSNEVDTASDDNRPKTREKVNANAAETHRSAGVNVRNKESNEVDAASNDTRTKKKQKAN